jgi:hypothetical protein
MSIARGTFAIAPMFANRAIVSLCDIFRGNQSWRFAILLARVARLIVASHIA